MKGDENEWFATHLKANYSWWCGTILILPRKRNSKHQQQENHGNCILELKGGSSGWFYTLRTTINIAAYCETLKRFERPIQNRRRGLLTCSICLLHKNARAHTLRAVQQLLQHFGWEVLDHLVHKPDLLPGNFHLLLHLKKRLSARSSGGWKGEKRSHCMVAFSGSRVLWLQNTRTYTQAKQIPWQSGDNVEK